MLSKLKKVLPLNISVNLVLLKKNKVDKILIESYKYNRDEKRKIFKFLDDIFPLFFKNQNPSEQDILEDKKMLRRMLRNNITVFVSKDRSGLLLEKPRKIEMKLKRERRVNRETEMNRNEMNGDEMNKEELNNSLNELNNNKLSYLIKFVVFDEMGNNTSKGKVMKEMIVDKLDDKLLEELKKYYKTLENINRGKFKVEMTVEYIKKKVEKNKMFKINKFVL
jgi:hypothetical protein